MRKEPDLAERLGYSFKDAKLLKLALTHPSLDEKNNQRLEFLGDAVLELCMSDLLFRRHSKLQEGELTRLRAGLVCEDALYEVAQALSLAAEVRSNPPIKMEDRGAKSILADAVEAIIAAIYLDGGLASACALIERLWCDKLTSGQEKANPKSSLQELLQADGRIEPSYMTLAQEGPAHKRTFTVAVLSGNQELARAEGSSKKLAEQKAAAAALRNMQSPGEKDEA
ncbi:MAG: ribonuclease III [Christensenellales bacterium]